MAPVSPGSKSAAAGLPIGFRIRLDPTTEQVDAGHAHSAGLRPGCCGCRRPGEPALAELRRRAGAHRGRRRARPAADRRRPGPSAAAARRRSTSTSPWWSRFATDRPPRPLPGRARIGAPGRGRRRRLARSGGDRRRRRADTARRWCAAPATAGRALPATPALARRRTPTSSRSSTATASCRPAGSRELAGALRRSAVAAVAPRIVPARPGPSAGRYARDCAAASTSARRRAGSPRRPRRRTSRRPPCSCGAPRWQVAESRRSSTRACGSARTSTWSGGCTRPAGGSATTRRSRSRHDEPQRWRDLLGRRFRYGTSAGPLARRHPGRLAPLVLHRCRGRSPSLLACRRRSAGVALAAIGGHAWMHRGRPAPARSAERTTRARRGGGDGADRVRDRPLRRPSSARRCSPWPSIAPGRRSAQSAARDRRPRCSRPSWRSVAERRPATRARRDTSPGTSPTTSPTAPACSVGCPPRTHGLLRSSASVELVPTPAPAGAIER